jgi:hypothetical protein
VTTAKRAARIGSSDYRIAQRAVGRNTAPGDPPRRAQPAAP